MQHLDVFHFKSQLETIKEHKHVIAKVGHTSPTFRFLDHKSLDPKFLYPRFLDPRSLDPIFLDPIFLDPRFLDSIFLYS